MDHSIAEEADTATLHKLDAERKDAEAKLEASLAFGYINLESSNGLVHNNCKALSFQSVDAFNRWFETNPGTFAVQVNVSAQDIICIVDRVLSDEEQEILRDRGEAINQIMAERRALREKANADAKALEDKRTEELETLVELGKKCQHNHGAVIEDNAKLKKEIKDLQKRVK